MSLLVRCPGFYAVLCDVATNRVFGTAKCVPFIEVSSFQGVLIRDIQTTHSNHVCYNHKIIMFGKFEFLCNVDFLFSGSNLYQWCAD